MFGLIFFITTLFAPVSAADECDPSNPCHILTVPPDPWD